MPIETNLNQSPFYDDYDEAKNFHRVLFRPGYAVQARELTQLQTILQNQIERGFNEILKDGTVVTGVPITSDRVQYVKLRDKDANTRSILTSDFYTTGKLTNAIAVGTTSGITGQIVGVEDGSEAAATTGGNFTLFINYMDSGTDNATKNFADNEVITVRLRNGNNFVVAAKTIATSATGKGFRAMVGDGVVYNKGHFVRVIPQSHIMSKYTTNPTRFLGFQTTESTINSNEDVSLLDNATGATNYAAPGAERLKLYPTLTSIDPAAATANTSTFFVIGSFEEGLLVKDNKETELADLGNYIGNRIYETHGDYVTKPFHIRIREHLRSADNLGRYNSDSTPAAGNSNKLVAEIEPGVGYVRGVRTETTASIFRTFDKATDYETKDARTLSISYGNYVIVDECVGPWDMRSLRTIDLRSAAGNAISTRTHGSTAPPGSSVGSAKVRGFEYHSGTSGHAGAQYRIYLFDIKMEPTKNFADHVRSLAYAATINSIADCVLESDKAIVKETNINSLIFPFSQKGTKKLRDAAGAVDTQWVTRKASKLVFSDRSATLSIPSANTAAGGTEVFNDSVTSATDRKKYIVQTTQAKNTVTLDGSITATGNAVTGSGTTFQTHFVVGDIIREAGGNTAVISAITDQTHLRVLSNSLGGTTASSTLGAKTYTQHYPAGHIFDFSTDGGSSTDDNSTQRTIHIGGANVASGSWTGEVFHNVSRSSAVQTAKVINKNRYVHLNIGLLAGANGGNTGPWSLGVPDAMKIRKVWKGSNTGVTAANGTDVTSHFILDTGATDSFYGTSKLRKKTTSSLGTAATVGLLVEFDHFIVDTSSGIGFFSVDSYPIDDTLSSNTTAIMTKDIPVHTSPSTGTKYDLRNSIDFRPRLAATATPHATGTAAAAPTNPASLTTITHDDDFGAYVPTPDENFQCDVQFYLPRKDNIVLTRQGNIEIVKGLPSTKPRTPFDIGESMILATANIPVFPSLSSHVAKQTKRRDLEVRLDLRDNRRFTMKDLRAVSQRVKNLEYYASLNTLESSAKNKQIFSATGADRFKNGFFVDNFDGHNNADRSAEGYLAAIDINNSQLRPTFKRKDIGLKLSTSIANSAIRKTGNLITLAYTDVSYINQDKATKLRNPCQEISFVWNGNLDLNPDIDNTPDVTQLPDIQIDFNGIYDSMAELGELLGLDTGINYGSWETVNTTQESTTGETTQTGSKWVGDDQFAVMSTDTTTTITEEKIKKGTQLNVSPGKNEFEIGNFVDNVAVRDYMRSRNLRVTAYGMRPSTRVYPYFDDELVGAYCTPANSSYANTNIEGSSLITNASGTLYANFRIPNDDNLKFRIGERKFELKDVANTQTGSTLLSTKAHSTFVSTPLDVQMQSTSVNIASPQYSYSHPILTENFSSTTVETSTQDVWIDSREAEVDEQDADDPLAQTFSIHTNDRSEGIFITKLDLFFGKKSSTYPCTVEIREVLNGAPTPVIVPFGRKTLLPSEINVNASAATSATTFTFDSPIFLKNSNDYCFVIRPAGLSTEFALWCAELGAKDVDTGVGVYKVPSFGVMLTSSNDKTWTPHQKEDVKYKMYRAEFTRNTGTLYLENEDLDMFTIDSISGPGFRQGEKVTAESVLRFANNQGAGSFSVGQIIQNHQAKVKTANTQLYANGVIRQIISTGGGLTGFTYVKLDSYGTFAPSANVYIGSTKVGVTHAANADRKLTGWIANTSSGTVDFYDQSALKLRLISSTGAFANGYMRGQASGHTARITTTTPDNAVMSMTVPKVPVMTYANTSATWALRNTSTGGVISPSYTNVNLGEENHFRDTEKKLYSKTNEAGLTAVGGNRKTYVIQGTLATTNTKVSPIIHAGKSNAIIIENVINNVSTNEHKEVGDSLCRYMTKAIQLGKDQDAEDIKVFLTAYKPIGTEVSVFARILNNEDGEALKDKSYSPLTQLTDSDVYSDSVDITDLKEFEYGFSANTDATFLASTGANTFARLNSSDSSIVAYEDSTGGVYKGYKTFAIKIVMTSTGTNVVPLIKDMRATALQV